tara:strand:- start:227 stop:415 length:189 start_codon:yes stop_codon:yes gene_type:complete
MSNENEVTMDEWIQYRAIQDSGMFNMFDPQAREMTDVSRDKWIKIIKNYSELKEKFEGEDNE